MILTHLPAALARSCEPALRRVRTDGRVRAAAGALAALVLLALVLVGRAQLASPVRIASGSMTPTLLAGDVVLVDRTGLDADDLRRGDLVTFSGPLDGVESLKRVVALPGDTVGIVDAVLHVNGRPGDEPYVDASEWDGMFTARVHVPPGAVYVLGDERISSVDSRQFGPVPLSRLDGRVLVRLWPPVRLGQEPPVRRTPSSH